MIKEMITQEPLKVMWKTFVKEGRIEGEELREIVRDSWERSRRMVHDPYTCKPFRKYEGEELDKHLEKHHKMIKISAPVMKSIYSFLKGKFVVSLSDKDSCLLEIIGDEKVRVSAEIGYFMQGAAWSEEAIGTNGIGTCAYLDRPLQIHGREHYRRESHHWTGSSAPIHNAEGNMIGILSIVGPSEEVHIHTLGIVVTAVNAIESQMELEKALSSLEVSNNYKNAVIESISEGLLAIDRTGSVTQINKIMAGYLGVNAEDILNQSLVSVMSEKNVELFELVKNPVYITDREIDIFSAAGKRTFLVTSRSICGKDIKKGIVFVFNDISRVNQLVQRIGGANEYFTFAKLIGKDRVFLDTVELARRASESTSSVLLLGESGTGKDVFAQAIHYSGIRKKGPFVALNCGAIPRELIESEMFGYVDGAFTGAKRGGKQGKFELASGGTIFLDEIGDMPLELQITLLRVLETKKITRIGGHNEIDVDVRIIAATNKDLDQEVSLGKFRHDLFYRINVFKIRIMPLRERPEDIPALIHRFLETLCIRMKKLPIQVDKKAMGLLKKYSWPGNIRELHNVMERIVNICDDTVLAEEMLPPEIRQARKCESVLPVQNYEKELIKELLQKHDRNITRVANELGVARTTVYQKIAKYKI